LLNGLVTDPVTIPVSVTLLPTRIPSHRLSLISGKSASIGAGEVIDEVELLSD
jgi:hypothetical protein